jgi:hypothetical protein
LLRLLKNFVFHATKEEVVLRLFLIIIGKRKGKRKIEKIDYQVFGLKYSTKHNVNYKHNKYSFSGAVSSNTSINSSPGHPLQVRRTARTQNPQRAFRCCPAARRQQEY